MWQVDVLSDVLATAKLQSNVLGRLALRAPWAMKMKDRPHSVFHVMLEGTCVVGIEGSEPRMARRGDVMLMASGRAHELRDAIGSKAVATELGPGRPVVAIGNGAPAEIVCGAFRFEDRHTNLLLAALPEVVHVHELAGEARPWLAQTLSLIGHEARTRGPGSQAALSGLCDALFIYVLREHLAQSTQGWLGALRDAHVGAALRLIHAEPSAEWSVPTLASRVAMSRSAFAARFTELVGRSPLQYVIGWRLQKAASLLRASRVSIAEIAESVGYESEPAFHKAFKRAFGVAPGAYRAGARDGGSDKRTGRMDMERAALRA